MGEKKAVIFCSDQNGLPFALMSAVQIALIAPNRDFDILICGMEKLEIPQLFQGIGIKIHVLEMPADGLAMKTGSLPTTSYLRLWLPEFFLDIYERILYLDIDTYFQNGDISRLMDSDIGDHAVAGVRDIIQWELPNRPVYDFEEEKLSAHKYLNAGVLLIDVKSFVDQKIQARCVAVDETIEFPKFHDQSLLNLVLLGNWAEFSPIWNWQNILTRPILGEIFRPNILHFCGPDKPWKVGPTKRRYPMHLISEYRRFLALHFPERKNVDFPPAESEDKNRKVLEIMMKNYISNRKFKQYFSRFESEFAVIL